jgi:probable rRNA maturation factor
MEISIYNETNEKLDDEIKIMKDVLVHGVNKLNVGDVIFNVIIVDNDYIHRLNKEYRGIDRETDVISFALEEGETIDEPVKTLGDIYISIDRVYSQAKEYGHSVKRELFFLVTHGFLHLLGYDHMKKEDEEVMFPLQEKILDNYGVKRV